MYVEKVTTDDYHINCRGFNILESKPRSVLTVLDIECLTLIDGITSLSKLNSIVVELPSIRFFLHYQIERLELALDGILKKCTAE